MLGPRAPAFFNMNSTPPSIAYLDGPRLARGLAAGIRHLFRRREYINRINVFPVPDGDTGTNMAFTFRAILERLSGHPELGLGEVLERVTEASLDGARGNSGAIMAQFFQGFREAAGGRRLLTANGLAAASARGAEQAWTAMAEPVAGTLPTVLEDFADELTQRVAAGVTDIRMLLRDGMKRAHASLANTPNQLPVLKQAGVVDAGGQGFVDLLEGIWAYTDRGEIDALEADMQDLATVDLEAGEAPGDHRYCTECVIDGQHMDRGRVMARLQALDGSSLVVAGSPDRIRVHIHVNQPAEVFLACEAFGEITQQKADDMQRQHGLMNQPGRTAIVVDSAADLPESEIERLGINVVPVRLSFGDREFLDRVSIKPTEFYRMLEESEELPRTSQPPAQDFRRVYSLLCSHGYEVVSVGLTRKLSGTTQAAASAAERVTSGRVEVFDTENASCGQALLAIVAAEAAAGGMTADEILALLAEMAPQALTIAITEDLSWAVRGGRVPAWVKKVCDVLNLTPVLMARRGTVGFAGVSFGKGASARALAARALARMQPGVFYRVLIAHVDNDAGAHKVRRLILARHPMIHSCHITEAGPALGVHFGRGGLIAGILPQPEVLG